MPRDKDLKRLVRDRMARTKERYTQARAAITGDERTTRSLIERLADADGAREAWKALRASPPYVLRHAAIEGLRHENWRVRRGCARLLDDLPLTATATRALARSLEDPHPRVRIAAFHTLVCEGCKPDGCLTDVRALAVEMLADPSAEVRQRVLTTLWDPHYRLEPGALLQAVERVASADPSAFVRDEAKRFLDGVAQMQKVSSRFVALPAELRAKAEHHAGKWIAVADGRVITADRHIGQVRRDAKGQGRTDAEILFVPPIESPSRPQHSREAEHGRRNAVSRAVVEEPQR